MKHLLVLVWGLVATTGAFAAATHTAASCSYSDVNTAVTAAHTGDVVAVPACASTSWGASVLSIGKSIHLKGAGIGSTIITGTGGLISYLPTTPANNQLFAVSGFTFDFGAAAGAMRLASGVSTTIQTKIRIHDNRFQNASGQYLNIKGVRGVAYKNEFAATNYPIRFSEDALSNGGASEWNNWEGVILGQRDNNFWFEDNTFEGVGDILVDCQVGNRYAFRYNTITMTAQTWPLADMHGNQDSDFYSCFGGELYGNNILGNFSGRLLDHRGGRVFMWNNNYTGSMDIQIREEIVDSADPVTYVGPNPPQMPQQVSGSYYWGNRRNMTGASLVPSINTVCGTCIQNGLAAGVDFFTTSSSPGVSAGTLANRPNSCTTGQGYWATNQSTTNLTGMVGRAPSTPNVGTLYRCVANAWDAGTKPLSYPHPLRVQAGPTPPVIN